MPIESFSIREQRPYDSTTGSLSRSSRFRSTGTTGSSNRHAQTATAAATHTSSPSTYTYPEIRADTTFYISLAKIDQVLEQMHQLTSHLLWAVRAQPAVGMKHILMDTYQANTSTMLNLLHEAQCAIHGIGVSGSVIEGYQAMMICHERYNRLWGCLYLEPGFIIQRLDNLAQTHCDWADWAYGVKDALTRYPRYLGLVNQALLEGWGTLMEQVTILMRAMDGGSEPMPLGFVPRPSGDDSPTAGRGMTRLPDDDGADEPDFAEHIRAAADLYHIYQHERLGVFQTLLKLQALFADGTLSSADEELTHRLAQYDRRQVLLHTQQERLQAYRRIFGYDDEALDTPFNAEFHPLFVRFLAQAAAYSSDSQGTTSGNIAVARHAALALRNSLIEAAYGSIYDLRSELVQLFDEGLAILESNALQSLFGAGSALSGQAGCV